MPASAMPTGRPMASTEPKARMSTIMAKAKPSNLSDFELGEDRTSDLDLHAFDLRHQLFSSAPISVASSSVMSRGGHLGTR